MIRIGEFANLFDVSIKTIRLYEEKGLLFPCLIDKYSGYRYYDEKNIEDMTKILVLKDLGLSLKEIKDFDDCQISNKIEEYEKQINKIRKNLNTLKSLSHNKEGIKKMKTFVNDEKVIGKWKLLGVADSEKNASLNIFIDDDFKINELYLMPNGEEYWVISWTKGSIFINGTECPYQIEEYKMYLKVVDPTDNSFYKTAVYEKIDNKKYTIDEIKTEDNINILFVEDNKLNGCWQSVDFVNKPIYFNPNKKYWQDELYLEKIIISSANDCIAIYNSEESNTKQIKYTKDYFINLCLDNTLSNYKYQNIDNNDYIIVEWKSGDYVYGKMINGYYVLKRID